jgi:cyanophycinase-like exopeptidase
LRKPVTLIAGDHDSPHFGTTPYLGDALALAHKDAPIALYIGAASGDHAGFGRSLCGLIEAAGAREVLWPKLTGKRREKARAHDALERVDFVFVGGGDVEAGMEALRATGLVDPMHNAATRGVIFAGMSAGAIMLGERWVRWPGEDARDDEAETYECLGIAPCSLDTHGEADRWRETQSFAAVRARETGKRARAYAVPSGGALVITASGALKARGEPVPVFAALPGEKAKREKTLEAT